MSPPPTSELPYNSPGRGGCLKVLGVGCLVLAVVLTVVVVLAVKNFERLAVYLGHRSLVAVIEGMQIPPEQRQEIIAEIDRIRDEFNAGNLSKSQLGTLFEEISRSPALPVGLVLVLERTHIRPSGLDEQEKAEAHRTLQRFARGVIEGRIDRPTARAAAAPLLKERDDESWVIRGRVTDSELRDFLAKAREQVEQAGVPDEPHEVDLAGEIRTAVDAALAADPAEEKPGK